MTRMVWLLKFTTRMHTCHVNMDILIRCVTNMTTWVYEGVWE